MSLNPERPKYHVALSPDGQQVVTFNTVTLELNVCYVRDLESIKTIKFKGFNDINPSNPRLSWSLAISNSINLGGTRYDSLIGISCFDVSSNPTNEAYFRGILEDSSDNAEQGRSFVTKVAPRTWVLSTLYQDRLKTSFDEIGGVIRFLTNPQSHASDDHDLVLIHEEGISKITIENNYVNRAGNFVRNRSNKPSEDFIFPTVISNQIEAIGDFGDSQPKLQLFHHCIEKHYFLVENFKMDLLEIYDLKNDGELYKTFHARKESFAHANGISIIQISNNDVLMAYCRGSNSVSIYLMENTLEIQTKVFPNLYRINSIDFIHNDEKLLLVGEEDNGKGDGSSELITVIIIWDLFSGKENAIRTYHDTEKIIPARPQETYHKFASASGVIVCVNEDNGNIFSIVDHPSLENILNPPPISSAELIQLNFQEAREQTDQMYHPIFTQDGKSFDAKEEPRHLLVVYSTEPWVRYKQYPRISAYLNKDKDLQVIIGLTTIQVWRRGNDNSSKRTLVYIWTIPDKTPFEIHNFSIGNGEFFIDLSYQDTGEHFQIHWPHKCHILKDACSALEYLYYRRNEPTSIKRKRMFNTIVNQTSDILRNIIETNPDFWRLTDARYEIMQSLIRGRCVSLIKRILSEGYHGTNFKMGKNLHFPRLYEWPLVPKKSDLQLAIEYSGDNRKDTIIVGYLLNYYSDNAMNNSGWMITISQALPDLYDNNMDYYVKELFHKPCFGAKEVNVDMSFIDPKDLLDAHYRSICALGIRPALLRKSDMNPTKLKRNLSTIQKISNIKGMLSFQEIAKEAEETIQDKKFGFYDIIKRSSSSLLTNLLVVPLPDFTVYPPGVMKDHSKVPLLFRLLKSLIWPRQYAITDDSHCSPFLRAIRRDDSDEIFSNPAIAAIIDYKWTTARKHFLRRAFIYVVFAILFASLTGLADDGLHLDPDMNKTVYLVLQGLFFYLGYYLIAIEIAQMKREGFSRYLNLYNFLDMTSCLMPMCLVITSYVCVLLESPETLPKRPYSVALAFTTLFMWGQLLLLLRFFRSPATYIYIIVNILKKIWPFLAFMLIVVLGIGHAMYLLLRNPPQINLDPSGTSFIIQNASDPNSPNAFSGLVITQSYDTFDINDNYFSNFWKSLESVFFWINGRWDQLDQWNFIPIDILTLLASILLVTIMQNMLIAFMTGAFDDAQSSGEDAVLRYRADLIAEYETLEKPFGPTRKDPRYIYYVGNADDLSRWLSKAEEYRLTHRSLLNDDIDFTSDWSMDYHQQDDDDSDDFLFDDATSLHEFIVSKSNGKMKEDTKKSSKKLGRSDKELQTVQAVEAKFQPTIDNLQEKINGMEYKIEKILELLVNQEK
ncbi:transient receptor potential cation channel subfamily a member 1-like isoform x1 [Gigaspora margarita]|uniref:Transient receptor potential cation channel subfamily a member 1-like isoform x1 n=2 Tax=Gigaspora margarita TaxID=4874 RepID=A0A8H3XCH6_GIGMA|nr:transient receptor potential cation channel subfamily a member 1-like isoform x1 [Gigaspora margarita]